MTVVEPRTDGRSLRASRTRTRILEAHRSLLQGGVLSPTASAIATAAGISPRTFFLHFPDLEALFVSTATAIGQEAMAMTWEPDTSLPLGPRTAAFLGNRFEIYRYLTPFALASQIREQTSQALRSRRTAIAHASRMHVAQTFAPELRTFHGQDYEDAVAGLETSVTWSAWYHVCEEMALGEDAAYRVLHRNVVLALRPEG